MIFCKRCGYEGIYTGRNCPNCGSEIELSENEIKELLSELRTAKETGEYETVVENYKILADFGHTESEREYGKLLEKGGIVPRNLDAAMEYFYRAAKKYDPYATFRYSRLVSRGSDESGSFWLAFSALLGCPEAYLPAAEDFAAKGKQELANYYYYLAACCDELDAIVALAQRYYSGEGIVQSPEYAKWYMDRLTFPPFYAIKLAYKLRGVKAKEAPPVECTGYDAFIRGLYGASKRYGFDSASFYLAGMLADRGDNEAATELGLMYLNGMGTEKNSREAVRALTRAAASGSAKAYELLGKIYLEGRITEKNTKLALECLDKSAKLGNGAAYELMGDVYHSAEYENRNVAHAWELYDLAAKAGSATAREKAAKIEEARKAYYFRAEALAPLSPPDAFRCYGISTMLGYLPAAIKLAECYENGTGTEKDRPTAFYWYKNAADAGLESAYYPLGLCYARGIGTRFNFRLALDYLKRADKLGEERAFEEIKRLYENKKRRMTKKLYSTGMRLIYQKKFLPASQYLELATRFSHPKSIYTLGCLYEFGRGVECDKSKAYSLYDEAMKNSFSDPRSAYKLAVLKMLKKTLP